MATKVTKGTQMPRAEGAEKASEAAGTVGWSLKLPSGVILPDQVKFVGEDGVTITFDARGPLPRTRTSRHFRSTDDSLYFAQLIGDKPHAQKAPVQNKQGDKTSSDEADDEAQAAIVRRAEEVIGDRSDAMRWLGTPVRALNYATPISLLYDAQGREEVLTVLGRLEHGVL